MPVYTRTPISTSYAVGGGWTLGAGASLHAAMAANDDGTTFISATGANKRSGFYINPPLLASLAGVKIGGRGRMTVNAVAAPDPEGIQWGIYLGSWEATISQYVTDGSTFTWTDAGPTTALRPGGGSFSIAELATLQLAVSAPSASTSSEMEATYIYAEITGQPPSGGFAFLVASLVGAALGLHEMPKLAHALWQKTGDLILPAEYRRAWEEVRAARHPVWSFAHSRLPAR